MSSVLRSQADRPAAARRRLAVASVLLATLTASACSSGGGGGGRAANGGGGAAKGGGPSSTAPPPAYTGPPVAAGANPLGAKFDYKRINNFAPYLQKLSGGATFYEMVWCDVEPEPGAVNWRTTDSNVESGQRLGLTTYLKIRVGSCWATGGRGKHVRGQKQKTESLMPKDLGTYESFVRAAVERYTSKGVHEYALENEINSDMMWGGSPEDYVKLLTVAVRVIRAVDPSAKIVDPGISSTAYGVAIADRLLSQGHDDEAVAAYQRYYGRRTTRGADFPPVSDVAGLRSALGTEQATRNLAYLAMANRLAADGVVDIRQLHFYEEWDNVPALLDYVHATLPPKFPVEAWEVGMFWQQGTSDQKARAGELTKTVTLLLAGGVRRVIWLPLAADPTGRNADEPRYGLVEPDGTVRSTGVALEALVKATRGASVRSLDRAGVRGIALGRSNGSTLVFWSDKGTTLKRGEPTGSVAAQVGGSPVQWGGAGLQLGAQPVMVDVPGPLDNAVSMVLG